MECSNDFSTVLLVIFEKSKHVVIKWKKKFIIYLHQPKTCVLLILQTYKYPINTYCEKKKKSGVHLTDFEVQSKGFWCEEGNELVFYIGKRIIIDKTDDKNAKHYLVTKLSKTNSKTEIQPVVFWSSFFFGKAFVSNFIKTV